MIIAGIFDSFFSSDKKKVEENFSHLEKLGYARVAPSDAAMLSSVRQLKPIGGNLFAVRYAAMNKRTAGVRYISDLHLTMNVNPGASSIAEWTIITQLQPMAVKAPVSITPRTIAYEMLFKRTQMQEEVDMGMLPEFVDLFYAFSRTKGEVWVPEPIQRTILKCSLSFPFKALEESIAIAHISPRGWSILCDRVKNAVLFNDLLKVADQLEQAAGHATA